MSPPRPPPPLLGTVKKIRFGCFRGDYFFKCPPDYIFLGPISGPKIGPKSRPNCLQNEREYNPQLALNDVSSMADRFVVIFCHLCRCRSIHIIDPCGRQQPSTQPHRSLILWVCKYLFLYRAEWFALRVIAFVRNAVVVVVVVVVAVVAVVVVIIII